jgi:hypothetical protein
MANCSTCGMVDIASYFACGVGGIEQLDEWIDLQRYSCRPVE